MKQPSESRGTALIVFETLPPYGRECITILALPKGCHTRFRFKIKWFALDDPEKLVGIRALIALRHTPEALIIPLRFCEIIEVLEIGQIYYLVVILKHFVEYSTGPEGQSEQIQRFQQLLRDRPLRDFENTPGEGMEKLVFIAPDYSKVFGNPHFTGDKSNRETAAWGTLVEMLIGFPEFESLDFLHISKLGELHSDARVEDGEFILTGKRYYRITILQRRKNVEPAKDILIRLDRNLLTPVLDRQTAVGAYDVLELSFYTGASAPRPQRSSIVLSAECADKTISLFPPLIVPVTIKRESMIGNMLVATMFILAAFALLAPDYVSAKLHINKTVITEDLHNLLVLIAIVTAASVGKIGSTIVSKAFTFGK
jgi:hypothetical protein